MISKQIQKEKDTQEKVIQFATKLSAVQHKQSLINFKEYLEEMERVADDCINVSQLKEDIKELEVMIGRYE